MIDKLLSFLTPVVKFIGKLHAPFARKRVTGKHYYLLRDRIEVGTVLLTKTNGELSNLINPEKIKHAGIFIGRIDETDIRYVLESTGKGVVVTDLVTFLTTKDLVVGCRPWFLTDEDRVKIPIIAKNMVGIPYDYLFAKGPKAMYCFEAVAHLFKIVCPDVELKCRKLFRGKEIYSYETFLKDKCRFSTVFHSDKV